MRVFGLVGKTLKHSFSKTYFEKKFNELGLSNCAYLNFELNTIDEIKNILATQPQLTGFNVTNPYKEAIMPFLNELDEEAKTINAVNCVKITNNKLIGYNTDCFGFASSLKPFIEPQHSKALILGTGGAAKAVAYALKKIGIEVYFVTTKTKVATNMFYYNELNQYVFNAFKLIVNTTPLGLFPNNHLCPDIPYEFIGQQHLCYDLIYNPELTLFLQKAKQQKATTINGLSMLHLQAEKSWEIWNG